MHLVGLKALELVGLLLHLRFQHCQIGRQVGQQDLPHCLVPQGSKPYHSTCRHSKLLFRSAGVGAGSFAAANAAAPVANLALELAISAEAVPSFSSAPLKEKQEVAGPDVHISQPYNAD